MQSQYGLTLLGFLAFAVTLAILGLAAAPNLTATVKSNRDRAQIKLLLESLQLARRAAMQSASNVAITPCQADAPHDCNAPAWDRGWVVRYVTPPPGATRLIRGYPALAGGNRLSGSAGARIVFHPNGTTSLIESATFTLCDQRGAREARAVTVFISGVAQASTRPGETVDGHRLTCPGAT